MIKVINVISDTNIGGAGRVLVNYLKYCDRDIFENKVLLPRDSKLKDEIEELNINTIELDGMKDKSLDIKAIFQIRNILKIEEPDIVHTHASMSARVAAKLLGICSIYTRHTITNKLPKWQTVFPGKQINGLINSWLSDGIIAVANAAAEQIVSTGVPKKKIEVVLNGVEALGRLSEEEKVIVRKEYEISTKEVVFAIVARLEEVKGHEYFIRAARRLVDKGLKAKFFICGVGENENELKSLAAELNMQDYIIFTGFVKNISKILNITHIMANCSFGTEATSLALLEAMSLGIPIIATDYGGNCDVVEDGVNGCIIPTKSAAAFVQAAEKIIWNSGMIAVMRKNAIEIYEQKFTANIMAKNIESVYKKIFENA